LVPSESETAQLASMLANARAISPSAFTFARCAEPRSSARVPSPDVVAIPDLTLSMVTEAEHQLAGFHHAL
jgi:hypothetical protein